MVNIEQAINFFGFYHYKIDGKCTTQEDFNNIIWYQSPDENGNLKIGSKPNDLTWDKVNTKWQELKTAYSNKEYARKRKTEYLSWQEQFEMIYKDQKNGTTTYKDHCDKVRSDNPKG